ncbi:heme/copper-type cytochrome/quinol oxidase subunit 4 [Paenibacillus shirakamiensis]|uniref:Heme/copper-type cytochrome/quinol oxidase subunit 4 n=1 Tax=Paenibacillus shirakamiensis TaxID=1265935 RepID=A0ABS4JFF3_9BACL|nr:DUF4870 domain-containing protein [Paenibacillus shirakamiensis]MBP2000439.1 heme/copper-type cytochrome/quinol oxidase subunit 4 [Paenibacillus shirakamiensis]
MRQVLSSLSYFSIFFAPFIFPIILWIIAGDVIVRKHASKALMSHLFPFLAAIPLLYFVFISSNHPASLLIYILIFAIIYFGSFVYNIVQGIRVLTEGNWNQRY